MHYEAAKPKGASRNEDAPRQEPMRGSDSQVRRNPSTDQKKVRRQMAKKASELDAFSVKRGVCQGEGCGVAMAMPDKSNQDLCPNCLGSKMRDVAADQDKSFFDQTKASRKTNPYRPENDPEWDDSGDPDGPQYDDDKDPQNEDYNEETSDTKWKWYRRSSIKTAYGYDDADSNILKSLQHENDWECPKCENWNDLGPRGAGGEDCEHCGLSYAEYLRHDEEEDLRSESSRRTAVVDFEDEDGSFGREGEKNTSAAWAHLLNHHEGLTLHEILYRIQQHGKGVDSSGVNRYSAPPADINSDHTDALQDIHEHDHEFGDFVPDHDHTPTDENPILRRGIDTTSSRKTATMFDTRADKLNPGNHIYNAETGKTTEIVNLSLHPSSGKHVILKSKDGVVTVPREQMFQVVPVNSAQQSSPGYGRPAQGDAGNTLKETTCKRCGRKGNLVQKGGVYVCKFCENVEQGGAGGLFYSSQPDVIRTFTNKNNNRRTASVIAQRARQVLDLEENQ